MRSRFSNGLLVFGITLICWAPVAARDVNERFVTGPNARVDISNVSGSVRVDGWDRQEVLITGDLHKNAEMDLRHDDERVGVKIRKKSGFGRSGPTELRVQVPYASEVEVYVVSADIEVRKVAGELRLEVVSGDVEVRDLRGDAQVTSASGDIEIAGELSPSRVKIVSVSGDARVRDVAGEVDITTISGRNTVTGGDFERVRLESTSGRIEFLGGLLSGGQLDAQAISGRIELEIVDGDDLDVDIETFSGNIDNCMGEEAERKSKYGPGRQLRFSRGAADRDVRAKALSGRVELCAR